MPELLLHVVLGNFRRLRFAKQGVYLNVKSPNTEKYSPSSTQSMTMTHRTATLVMSVYVKSFLAPAVNNCRQ